MPKAKRQKCTALALKKEGWAYVYEILGREGHPIYVGRTTNETKRASAHQRTYSSRCRRLAAAIDELKQHTSSWTFAKNFRRVRGLEHGVPESQAAKYEAYFIWSLDTLHHKTNPEGCNSREGDHAQCHEDSFDDIAARLKSLPDNASLFSEEDRRRVLYGVTKDVVEAEAELDIVSSLRDACMDESGACPACVEEVYKLTETKHKAISNSSSTRALLRSLKSKYAKLPQNDRLDHQAFAKDMNNVKALLVDFLPNEENAHQQLAHRLSLAALKHVSHFIVNGEESASVCFTASMGVTALKVVEHAVVQRDEAGGLPGQSFQSRLAWCKPNSGLKGDLAENLSRVDALLKEQLTDEQRECAIQRRREVLEEIAKKDS